MSRIRIIAIAAVGALLILVAIGVVALWSPWSSAKPADISDLMQRAGCAASEVDGVQLYANATAHCDVAGGFVSFSTFDTTDLRDQWITAAAQFGGAPLVVGDTWVAMSESESTRSSLASALGGEVRPAT